VASRHELTAAAWARAAPARSRGARNIRRGSSVRPYRPCNQHGMLPLRDGLRA